MPHNPQCTSVWQGENWSSVAAFSRGVGLGGQPNDGRRSDTVALAVQALDEALREKRVAAMCARAERRIPGLATRRFCNATFLLTRLLARPAARGEHPVSMRRTVAKGGQVVLHNESGSTGFDGHRPPERELPEQLPATPPSATVALPSATRTLVTPRDGGFATNVGRPRRRSLPSVYVYDFYPLPINPYGPPIADGGMRNTTAASGPTYVNAIHARLAARLPPADPSTADLFFIPEGVANSPEGCARLEAMIDGYWSDARLSTPLSPCTSLENTLDHSQKYSIPSTTLDKHCSSAACRHR